MEPVQPIEKRAQINRDERHVLTLAVANLFFSMEDIEIERLLRIEDKHLQELSQLMIAASWKGIIDAYPYMKDQAHLLTGGEIRKECNRLLGEISRCKKQLPESQRTDVRMISKLKFVEETYRKRQIATGKRKAEPSAVGPDGLPKAPRVTAQRSFVGAAMSGAPTLFILRRQQIEFDIHTMRLGEGAFAYASKCKIHDDNFPEEWYVCKVIKMAEVGTPMDHAAALEATQVDIIHRGMVSPIGLCRDEREPMIIFRYWNGGNLRNWMWACRADGKTAPPSNYLSISRSVGDLERVKKYIFHIVNGIMQTMEFMHANDLLHNDFHQSNIFIHFSKNSDEVYAGIGDWGRSTRSPTTKRAVPMRGHSESAKREHLARYPWMAPETASPNPPNFCKEQDIYSLGYVIQKTLQMVVFEPQDPKRGFSKLLNNWCERAMDKTPSLRPQMYQLVVALASAATYNVDLPRHAGLRPFDE